MALKSQVDLFLAAHDFASQSVFSYSGGVIPSAKVQNTYIYVFTWFIVVHRTAESFYRLW
jgi:hypothetical protein